MPSKLIYPLNDIVEKKDGFLFFKGHNDKYTFYDKSLLIDCNRINKTIDYIIKKGIKSITINAAYYENWGKVIDLNFLKPVSKIIEDITISQKNINFSILNELENLKLLSFDEAAQAIDLCNFRQLKILSYDYSKNIINLDKSENLEWVSISNYKKTDLIEFSNLKKLKFLHIYGTPIKNLNGIGELENLEDFEIESGRKLETLDGLSEKNKNILFFSIDKAKNLNNLNSIKYLSNVEKVFLMKVGNLDNIDFVKYFNNIIIFCVGNRTKVEHIDENLLSKIKKVSVNGYKGNNYGVWTGNPCTVEF